MDELNTKRILIMENMASTLLKFNDGELDKLGDHLVKKTLQFTDENRNDIQGNKIGQMMNTVNLKLLMSILKKDLLLLHVNLKRD